MMVISELAVQDAGLEGETALSGGTLLQEQAAREGRPSARAALLSAPRSLMPTIDRQECWGHARGNNAPQAETSYALVFLDLIVSFGQPPPIAPVA